MIYNNLKTLSGSVSHLVAKHSISRDLLNLLLVRYRMNYEPELMRCDWAPTRRIAP